LFLSVCYVALERFVFVIHFSEAAGASAAPDGPQFDIILFAAFHT